MSAAAELAPESRTDKPTRDPVFAIVGNPNCGKSTIFNALTGLKQKVANYPGVTVEKREGACFSQHGKRMRLIDLPGTYSLNARSPDEAVVRDVLLGRRLETAKPDVVVCVADASNLERNLYLVTQVLELGLPSVLVLNMMDVAEAKHWRIDLDQLSKRLEVPVIPMQATSGKGLVELKAAMSRKLEESRQAGYTTAHREPPMAADIYAALVDTRATLASAGVLGVNVSLLEPLYLISDHDPEHYGIADAHLARISSCHDDLEKKYPGWEDTLAADRYAAVEKLLDGVLRRPERDEQSRSDKLDSVLLHPILGGICFFAIMGLLFYLIFSVAQGPMDWIKDLAKSASDGVKGAMGEGDLRDLITEGIIPGVGGVVVFLPQILILFFFIGLMEDTGYMSRVAFIMDRIMGKVGLNGRSFVPFLSSYACAVPGIMATRTIASVKDRIITILVAPLASCSARLPVYSLMIAAMFPSSEVSAMTKAGIMLAMYAAGTIGAFAFAWIFNRTLMKGTPSLMVLEMPTYKRPAFKTVVLYMVERAKIFMRRAGTVILGLSILLWAAMSYPRHEGDDDAARLSHSIAGRAGHLIEPVIKPLGYDWKVGIGIIASFAAREVFVGTMGIVYAVESKDEEDTQPLLDQMKGETWPDGRLVFTPLMCLSLMIFYVFAMQCLSTVAVVRRETGGWKWPLFQIAYMTATAWLASFVVYQGGKLLGF